MLKTSHHIMIIYWSVIIFSITEGQIVKMHFGIFSSKLTCNRVTATSHPGVCTFTRKSQKDQFFLRCVWRLGNRKHTARDSADGDVSSPQRTSHLWLVSAERLRAAAKFSHAANYHCTMYITLRHCNCPPELKLCRYFLYFLHQPGGMFSSTGLNIKVRVAFKNLQTQVTCSLSLCSSPYPLFKLFWSRLLSRTQCGCHSERSSIR